MRDNRPLLTIQRTVQRLASRVFRGLNDVDWTVWAQVKLQSCTPDGVAISAGIEVQLCLSKGATANVWYFVILAKRREKPHQGGMNQLVGSVKRRLT